MKNIFALITFISLISCYTESKQSFPETFVLDQENVLSELEERTLDSILRLHERRTTNEIRIITSRTLEGHDNEVLYATAKGNEIGVGKKEKNNGVVLFFSASLHKTAIATGRGTENFLSDEMAKTIIDSVMLPHFKQGEWFKGLLDGTNTVIEYLERPENKIE